MDLLDILGVVRKRWKVALVAAAGGLALLVLATTAVEPDWDGTAIVWIAPPASETSLDEVGNPIIEDINPVTNVGAAQEIVPLLAVVSTSQETRTTFAREGLSTAYEVEYVQRQPYITITVTDGDPNLVVATIDAVIDRLQLEVRDLQDETNTPESSRASVRVIAETEIAANNTNERRAQGVLVVLTIVAAVGAATLTDLYFRRRDEAAHEARYGPDPSPGPDPDPESGRADSDDASVTPIEKPNRWQRGSGSS